MRASLGVIQSAGLFHLQYQYKKIQVTKNVAPSGEVTIYFNLLFKLGGWGGYHEVRVIVECDI